MNASIVIRAKNEARDIGETLESICQQISVPQFEIIVVDSGSTDRTLEIARRYPTQIIEIPPESFTYGRALNIGVAAASGDFIIALSAHSLPATRTWLANMIEPFKDPMIAGVYGKHMPRSNATLPELFGMWFSGVMSDTPRRQQRDMMFSNANGAVRRHLALEHPYDEKLGGAEDLAWADWAIRQGWAVYYQPTAPVYHSHGESLGRLVRRMAHDQPTIWGLKFGGLARGQHSASTRSASSSRDLSSGAR